MSINSSDQNFNISGHQPEPHSFVEKEETSAPKKGGFDSLDELFDNLLNEKVSDHQQASVSKSYSTENQPPEDFSEKSLEGAKQHYVEKRQAEVDLILDDLMQISQENLRNALNSEFVNFDTGTKAIEVDNHLYIVSKENDGNPEVSKKGKSIARGGMGEIFSSTKFVGAKFEPNTETVIKIAHWNEESKKDLDNAQRILKKVNPDGDAIGLQPPPYAVVTYKRWDSKLNKFTNETGKLAVLKQYEGDSYHLFLGDQEKFSKNKKELNKGDLSHQVLNGLGTLRKNEIVHRDIKMDNLLYENNLLKGDVLAIGDIGGAFSIEEIRDQFIKTLKKDNASLDEIFKVLAGPSTPRYIPVNVWGLFEEKGKEAIERFARPPSPEVASEENTDESVETPEVDIEEKVDSSVETIDSSTDDFFSDLSDEYIDVSKLTSQLYDDMPEETTKLYDDGVDLDDIYKLSNDPSKKSDEQMGIKPEIVKENTLVDDQAIAEFFDKEIAPALFLMDTFAMGLTLYSIHTEEEPPLSSFESVKTMIPSGYNDDVKEKIEIMKEKLDSSNTDSELKNTIMRLISSGFDFT